MQALGRGRRTHALRKKSIGARSNLPCRFAALKHHFKWLWWGFDRWPIGRIVRIVRIARFAVRPGKPIPAPAHVSIASPRRQAGFPRATEAALHHREGYFEGDEPRRAREEQVAAVAIGREAPPPAR